MSKWLSMVDGLEIFEMVASRASLWAHQTLPQVGRCFRIERSRELALRFEFFTSGHML